MDTAEDDRLLRTFTEKSLAGIYVVQDGEFRFLNNNAASYTNYTVGELIGRKSGSFVHPEDREKVKANARAMLRGDSNSPYIFRILTKQGETRWIMETVTPLMFNGRPALLGNSMNITDRMEAELHYRTIFETTGTATVIVDEDTTVSLVNTEFEKLSGGPKDYWEGRRKWTEFVHEKDRERMLGYHYLRRVEPNAVPRNYEFSLVDRQGRVRDVLITISLIPGTKKSVASFADITDRKQGEELLRESEDRYRSIFETTGTATIIVDEDTTVNLVNTEFEKLSGAPKDYWEGRRKWTEFVHPDDREMMLRYHRLRRADPEAAPRNYEFRLVNMEGEVRDLIITISMIPGTKRSVASFVDITERKQAEEARKKNERDLQGKTRELEELNAALRVLLKRREEDKLELENNVISSMKKLVMPYIDKIKAGRIEGDDLVSLNIIESNLKDIASPFASKLSSEYLSLTPRELQVAHLVREGKTNKEIARLMSVSLATVEIHRYHIREKLGLSRKKANLRTYLSSLK
jgi:PAS domain S-box-containing protein